MVNNAGYSQSGAVEEVPEERVRRQFETNVFGLGRLCRLVLPHAGAGWGRIVNVSSMGGRFTFPGGGGYHASKYAVEALSDALRFEVKGFGVQVVVIEPGIIRTRFGDTAVREIDAGTRDPGPYGEFNKAVAESTGPDCRGPDCSHPELPMRSGGAGLRLLACPLDMDRRPVPLYRRHPTPRALNCTGPTPVICRITSPPPATS